MASRLALRLRDNRIARSFAVPALQTLARVSGSSVRDRVFLNSIPKSGTHLATEVYRSAGHLKSSHVHVDDGMAPERVANRLTGIPLGTWTTGHLSYNDRMAEFLDSKFDKIIVLVRDPRDVAASHAHYVLGNRRHYLHPLYRSQPDIDSCLRLSVQGGRTLSGQALPPLAVRIQSFQPWMERPDVTVLRFENLVDPSRFESEARLMLDGLSSPTKPVPRHSDVVGVKTMTLRSGKSGSWRSESGTWFADWCDGEEAADLLTSLGYEVN